MSNDTLTQRERELVEIEERCVSHFGKTNVIRELVAKQQKLMVFSPAEPDPRTDINPRTGRRYGEIPG